jgi:hypothetical protein
MRILSYFTSVLEQHFKELIINDVMGNPQFLGMMGFGYVPVTNVDISININWLDMF